MSFRRLAVAGLLVAAYVAGARMNQPAEPPVPPDTAAVMAENAALRAAATRLAESAEELIASCRGVQDVNARLVELGVGDLTRAASLGRVPLTSGRRD